MSVSIGSSLVHGISVVMRNAQKRSKVVDCSLRGAQPPHLFSYGGHSPPLDCRYVLWLPITECSNVMKHGPLVAYVTSANSSLVCGGFIIVTMVGRVLALTGGWAPQAWLFQTLGIAGTWYLDPACTCQQLKDAE